MKKQPTIRKFGLIGKTLKHSFSKNYFANKFENEQVDNAIYDLFELNEIELFKDLLKQETFSGLNVTIPYKKTIIPFLDELDSEAEEIQAVNTIKFVNGQMIGYNTDVLGFMKSIKKFIGRKKVSTALILGSGGASNAIQYCLNKLDISCQVVSRTTGDLTYNQVDKDVIRHHRLIVNCTPLGTFPNIDSAPDLPYKHLNRKHLLFDLVYNPEKTLFLKHGAQNRCSIMNGYDMLVEQAEASWRIWNTD